MVKTPGILIRQRKTRQIPAEGPDDRILKNSVLILQKIPIHDDFQEGKEPQIRLLMHLPSIALCKCSHDIKIGDDPCLGIKVRKVDPEMRV